MIINYNDFIFFNTKPLDFIETINESKGIPNDIKILTNIIFNKINPNETEYIIDKINNIDLRFINLKIEVFNKKNISYGYSLVDKYENKQLINPIIHIEFDFDNNDKKELKRIITHELLHIYEIYQRFKNNKNDSLQWILIDNIFRLRKKYEDDKFLSDLCLMIYYSSDQELNAVVAQTYSILMSCNSINKNILSEEMNSSKSWNIYKQLILFDIIDYVINYNRCLEFFKELNEVMKDESNNKYNIFEIPDTEKDVNKIIKNYIYLFRKKAKYLKSKLIKVVDEVIKDIDNFNSK
jgi:predicted SprT family Zn-dependent metalloprotease